ncbi:hypothetical protein IDH44_09075 [Paenibacillus sp. IB182496]|uniref:Tissue inhibitor of metalloproteinase n=1 Tax=Paenibacillus sabuli TaxID=2772509 RepID=A0A927GRK0_9BACL|nr:hypothetical protein [Paenibacillus sabuli]MBD2845341.1 hypothetical protein [Paenibacillus sabuli]
MRKGKGWIAALVLLQALVWWQPGEAKACSCAVAESVEAALASGDVVFVGQVALIQKTSIKNEAYDAALVEVDRVYQGIKANEAIVYTDWSSCQFPLAAGERYLLYAQEREDRLMVHTCSRSAALSEAAADLQLLGAGSAPSEQTDLRDAFHRLGQDNRRLYGLLALLVAIGAIAIIVRRMRASKR